MELRVSQELNESLLADTDIYSVLIFHLLVAVFTNSRQSRKVVVDVRLEAPIEDQTCQPLSLSSSEDMIDWSSPPYYLNSVVFFESIEDIAETSELSQDCSFLTREINF